MAGTGKTYNKCIVYTDQLDTWLFVFIISGSRIELGPLNLDAVMRREDDTEKDIS